MKLLFFWIWLLAGIIFFFINEKAGLYDKGLTPTLGCGFPFGIALSNMNPEVYLRVYGMDLIIGEDSELTINNPPDEKKDIEVITIKTIHWNRTTIVVEALTNIGDAVIKIEDYQAGRWVQTYTLVERADVLPLKNTIHPHHPPVVINYWRFWGSLYLLVFVGYTISALFRWK